MLAVSSALLNSWFVSGQGEFAQAIIGQPGGSTIGPTTTWNGQSTPVLGDVQKISCSTTTNSVYVNTPDLASYVMGAWWGNAAHTQPFINLPKDQNAIYKITLNTTYPQATHGVLGGGAVALAVNGVVIYNAGDAFSYSHASGTEVGMTGDGLFNRMAEAVESVTFDAGNGHQPGNGQYHYHTNPVALRAQLSDNVDYIGTTDYFPYDPAIYLLHQGEGADGDFRERTTNLHHSPIIGWMFDGYPIYGPYGYSSPLDPTTAVKRMQSSYALRSITDRTTLPGWAAQLAGNKLGAGATNTAADGTYTMTSQQQSLYAGPAVSTSYPLGRYGEDYAYVPGSGDLDQFCGRWSKTPEFPNGTYAYFLPIDAAGNPIFPFIVNRQMYGQPNGSGKVTSITETVTVAFNVATNTAPVVTGPAGISLPHSGTLAFTGAAAIAVSDIDAADEESIALTVTAGTLSVNLTSVLTSHVTVTAGANGSSTMTLKGGISLLNAALATLTYTAPASGATATLTAQANDGSAANNLSTSLSTAVTFNPSVSVPGGQTVTDATSYSGGVQLVKRGTGTLIVSGASSFTGGTRIEAGEVIVRNIAALGTGPVWVSPGARLTLDVGTAGISVAALTLDAAGLIDLGPGRMTIAAGGFTESVIRSRLIAGRGDGSWTGTSGITSRSPATVSGGSVGYATNGDGSLTVAFAAAGDTNLDGVVDILDVADLLVSGIFDSGLAAGWSQGDFTYDGVVDILDVLESLGASLFDAGPYVPASAALAPPATNAQAPSATKLAFAMIALEATAADTTKILERPLRRTDTIS
ncbi:MAG: YHYH protein [Planctomycetes bacterium]|nr:YHYH protein [Planctomycetota bacterium]